MKGNEVSKIAGCAISLIAALLGAYFRLAADCTADEWGPPREAHWSTNGQYVLKVTGGIGVPDELSLWRKTAAGLEKLWARGYVDETWPPHMAYVANDGKHVVLRDVYHNLGYGKVIVILGSEGQIVRSHELKEFLTQDEILAAPCSISSLWWSENGWFSLIDEDRRFALLTQTGTVCCFDVATGGLLKLDGEAKRRIVDLALAEIRPRLSHEDADERVRAATLVGAFGAKDTVSELKKLLEDRAVTCLLFSGEIGTFAEVHGVQLAAAGALARLLGPDAIPLIERQLPAANARTTEGLLRVIAMLDGGRYGPVESPSTSAALQTWRRLSGHESPWIREFAIVERLKREDGTYVVEHPDLLQSENKWTRYQALCCLSERGGPEAVPFLRDALNHEDSVNRGWALRGLIRLAPPDIEKILRECANSDDRMMQSDALAELVRRRDKQATSILIDDLGKLKDYQSGRINTRIGVRRACRLLVELKLQKVKPALQEAMSHPDDEVRRPVSWALAALGDTEALKVLRGFAQEGDPLDRCAAIEMLETLGDKGAIGLLRDAARDREPWVREAATKALRTLEKRGHQEQ